MNPGTIRPLQRFRIHFEDARLSPIDIEAATAEAARQIAARRYPGLPINKTKRVKEPSHEHQD